jgi:hypothetical protein
MNAPRVARFVPPYAPPTGIFDHGLFAGVRPAALSLSSHRILQYIPHTSRHAVIYIIRLSDRGE